MILKPPKIDPAPNWFGFIELDGDILWIDVAPWSVESREKRVSEPGHVACTYAFFATSREDALERAKTMFLRRKIHWHATRIKLFPKP